jgi:hypothetical protein
MEPFKLKKLKKLCSTFTFPKHINADNMGALLDKLGITFSELFNNTKRMTTGESIIERAFYIDNLDSVYLFKSLIDSGITLEQINSNNPDLPLYMFIYKYCNPEGYYVLEKSMLEVI